MVKGCRFALTIRRITVSTCRLFAWVKILFKLFRRSKSLGWASRARLNVVSASR